MSQPGYKTTRAFFVIALASFALLRPAFAGEFEGLKPGVSRKADADRILNAPTRELIPGERYDYDPAKHKARRISIRFARPTQIIESIDLYLQMDYGKSYYQEWFKLNQPDRKEYDQNGNLIEYYASAGLALHYGGPDDKSPVEFFSHYNQGNVAQATRETQAIRQAAAPQPAPQPLPSPQTQNLAAPAPSRCRIDLIIGSHDGQGVKVLEVSTLSPAARAGLRSGDILLELGNTGLYETRIPPARVGKMLESLQPGRPVRLSVQRGASRIEMFVTFEAFDPRKTELSKSAYDEGRKLMDAGDYAGAAVHFNEAISHDPSQSAAYTGLAESYYRRGDITGEMDALKRGVSAAPSYNLYRLLGFKYRETNQFDAAISAFNRAVALMRSNAKDAAVFEQLGFCLMKKRRYKEALPALDAAYGINSRSPATVFFLGGCHDSMKNRNQAVQLYRAYLALGDSNADWNQYAQRRLDALTKNPRGTAGAVDQLIDVLDGLIRKATDPN